TNPIGALDEETRSFDILYGGWKGVNGIGGPGYASHATQKDVGGAAYTCIPQLDVNLNVPPLSKVCSGTMRAGSPPALTPFDSHFTNGPFKIDDFIAPTDKTCPPPRVFAANGVLKDSPGATEGGLPATSCTASTRSSSSSTAGRRTTMRSGATPAT